MICTEEQYNIAVRYLQVITAGRWLSATGDTRPDARAVRYSYGTSTRGIQRIQCVRGLLLVHN